MPSPRTHRLIPLLASLALAVAAIAALSTVSTASAAPAFTAAPVAPATRKPAKLAVGVEVLRFNTAGRATTATGMVTASITDNAGHTDTVHTKVALIAATGGKCKVLHLFLNELSLNLLGLNAHLDKVQLDVTGNPHGGVLGTLFCRLVRAKLASARTAAATALSAGVRAQHGHVLRFSAYLNPAATAAATASPTCPVLDLVVGPLNLQLLGLVVDLNRVHLSVTATRGGGVLGNLFCTVANSTLPPLTTPTPPITTPITK
ncbi:MAG: hypothetical protein ACR2LV_08200 [Solirubrobacteraceae bacterium]